MSRVVSLIVIHCSATPNGRWITPEDIDGWHHQRGFHRAAEFRARMNPRLTSIGYHFVIAENGALFTGRHLDEVGAHVAGFNRQSIGVCMTGTDRFTVEQWDTLKANVVSLLGRYPDARVCGHRDLSPDRNKNGIVERSEWLKTCPGFDVVGWLAREHEPLPENIYTGERS